MTGRACIICKEDSFSFLRKGRDRLHFLEGEFDLYRCRRCGLIAILPPPSAEVLGRYYPQDYLNYHNAETAAPGPEKQPRSGALRRLLHPVKAANGLLYSRLLDQNRPFSPGKGKKVLDVGCGDGAYLLGEQASGSVCYGVDISEEALKSLRMKNPAISTFCGSLEDARYPDGFFEAVNLCNVLEHVVEAPKLMKETLRILKKGGRIRVQVPNARSCTQKIFRRFWMALDTPRHVYVFSSRNLPVLFASAGLRVVSWRTVENSYDVVGSSVYVFNGIFRKRYKMPQLRRLWDNEWLKLAIFPYAFFVNFFKLGDTVEFILEKREEN